MIECAVGEEVLVHLRLDVDPLDALTVEARPCISLSKWPMLQTIAWSFILHMWSA